MDICTIASQNAQGGINLQCKDNETSQSRSLEFVEQKGKLPADETKGSAFLVQVKSLYVIHHTCICV